jgi:histidine triad (HIT) family protein
MSCIFCRIVAGEIPAEIVARDERTLAFLDVSPLADGHVLVVPHAHVARIEELSAEDASALFSAVTRLVGKVRNAVGAEGTTIGINDGPATGQTVPHVHVHVVPRRSGDGGGSVHTVFRAGSRRPIAEIGAAIRASLPRGGGA